MGDDKNIMKDKKMQGIFQMIRDAFNAYRTHIRKNYPENYKSLKENEEDKLSENINRDTERSINNFIRKMAEEYGYSLQDAVYAIMKVLRDQNYIIPEMSTTGGGAGAAGFTPGEGMGYATPFAFTGGKKAKESKALKDLGYKLVKK